jgi:hypothetical protein
MIERNEMRVKHDQSCLVPSGAVKTVTFYSKDDELHNGYNYVHIPGRRTDSVIVSSRPGKFRGTGFCLVVPEVPYLGL